MPIQRFLPKTLLWLIFPSVLLIAATAILTISTIAYETFETSTIQNTAEELKSVGRLIENQVGVWIEEQGEASLNKNIQVLAQNTDIRITIVKPDGVVIADTFTTLRNLDNHFNRPEIQDALINKMGVTQRYSYITKKPMLNVTIPHKKGAQLKAIIRLAIPLSRINETLSEFYTKTLISAVMILLITGLLSYYISKRITKPIEDITRGAEEFARGNLKARLPNPNSKELETLSITMTDMATQMDDRIQALITERNEKEKLLIKLRQLERMRKDFVANVSHELRTPITLIKGFIETLINSPPDDEKETQRFLDIVNTHAERLNGIILDLLSLSKIEEGEEEGAIEFDSIALKPIIRNAIQTCDIAAKKKDIQIQSDETPDLSLVANAALIEQALINLIDNAIKYSPEKSHVRISCETKAAQLHIHISDNGPGIPEDAIPHLFQRFYRIDKARSRDIGGTGLGLSIVKHIAKAHKGEASVSSIEGKGSTFTLSLPLSHAQ